MGKKEEIFSACSQERNETADMVKSIVAESREAVVHGMKDCAVTDRATEGSSTDCGCGCTEPHKATS